MLSCICYAEGWPARSGDCGGRPLSGHYQALEND